MICNTLNLEKASETLKARKRQGGTVDHIYKMWPKFPYRFLVMELLIQPKPTRRFMLDSFTSILHLSGVLLQNC